MLSCTGPLALPGGRSVLKAGHSCQRSVLSLVARGSRKQSQGQSRDVGTDLASDGLPADLDKLSKLAKAELQHQLEVRGLDKDGNKEELASRLLDNLIAQESVLSTNPPDRVKLQQQLEQGSTAGRRGRRTSRKATASADPQPESSSVVSGSPQAADSVIAAAMTAEPAVEAPAAAAAGSRRGRKTSRKATSSIDPLPSAAEIAAGAAADLPAARRGRKTSRKATTSADPLPAAAPADIPAAAAAGEEASADTKPARRGRKTSRKATTSADPLETPAPQDPVAAAAEAATAAADSATESLTGRQRGRRSKTTAADPSPAAAATEEAAPAKAGRARRASRKSSVLEPESTDAAPTAAAAAEAPARQRGRRTSSAKSATADASAAAPAPSTPADAPVSRAKLLAQQLAKKEIATHGQGAAAAGAAAAAAAPGSAWVGADELLYAGSQAQSDSLLMGGDNSMQAVGAESSFTIDNGSVDEVFAQISAERAAGLADEPMLRPEATLSSSSSSSSSFDGVMNPPSAGAADAAASWGAAAGAVTAADAADGQHPSLTDCVAAVEEPLVTAAEAVEVDEAPDAAMAAFDHMYVHIASPGTAEADLQHPNLSDCVAAVEEPLLAPADPAPLVVVDEAPDAAMAAFDHTSLDSPAAAAVAGGNQAPNLQDIALAVESSPLPPSLDESLGEDEEPDAALAAFDHIDVPAPAAAAAAAAADDSAAAAAAYDQAYLDPMQPSATVGSGSVDLADAEVVVTAAAAAPAAVAAKQQQPAQQQLQQKAAVGGAQGAPDLSVMVQRWWASVVAMFEDWQKNLSGPK